MSKEYNIAKLKEQYVQYYKDVPVQKYAAMAIARDEDTIIRWRKEDPNFADSVQGARAEFVRKRVLAAKAEFVLERMEKEIFSRLEMHQEVSDYQRYIDTHTVNLNDSDAKQLAEDSLNFLMEKTKWKETLPLSAPALPLN